MDYTKGEINGREYKIYTLNNGDKCYFVDAVKGKEIRLLTRISAMGLKVKGSDIGTEGVLENAEINLGDFLSDRLETFTIFCHKIVKPDNTEIPVSMDYFDNCDEKDALLLQTLINEALGRNEEEKKA